MAAYLSYTLRMKTLFHGLPVMVNDTHTRRRRSSICNVKTGTDPYCDLPYPRDAVWTLNQPVRWESKAGKIINAINDDS